MECPICSFRTFDVLASRERIDEELRLRKEFFAARIDGHADAAEMKDRTDVVHATPAAIRRCRECGLLIRDDDGRGFTNESYAPYVMERMLRSHIDAFRLKERVYRPLLTSGARVLEVGSYVGGFLHVATEWHWDAIGVDVGDDTSQFAAAHGYRTRHATLHECAFDHASFDGVFIWNCFEQLERPHDVVAEVRRITRDGGIVVIRTPSARFYSSGGQAPSPVRTGAAPILHWIGHANLLAFPHRHGYTTSTLDRLMTQHRFEVVDHRGDMHIAPTHSRLTATAKREEDEMRTALAARNDANDWPWMECTYRAT